MSWICENCSSVNEDDSDTVCFVCGEERTKKSVRKEAKAKREIKRRVASAKRGIKRTARASSLSDILATKVYLAFEIILIILGVAVFTGGLISVFAGDAYKYFTENAEFMIARLAQGWQSLADGCMTVLSYMGARIRESLTAPPVLTALRGSLSARAAAGTFPIWEVIRENAVVKTEALRSFFSEVTVRALSH